MNNLVQRIEVALPHVETILNPAAQDFIRALEQRFRPELDELLKKRQDRQKQIDQGIFPDFLTHTEHIKSGTWQVAPVPADLEDRRVEITGPCERKMMINALNSGARVFMADLEDSLTPTWANIISAQINLIEAVRGTLSFTSAEGKEYKLQMDRRLATLVVRPRGLHLLERHLLIDEKPVSASLFDFGLYFFHNAHELIKRGSAPYFYLPKLESHEEARLWNDVFNFSQDYLQIERGTIRATVLIETILAAFEMEEILYQLKEHAAGLNAGRWDYIFSLIKKTRNHDFTLPDRAKVTMAVPFMRAYAQLLVATCHKRGAHAIGGMAAFIPSRKDQAVNETAIKKVTEDKEREAADGFDGTWVAHPDLVPIARRVFDKALGANPHQKGKELPAITVSAQDLLNTKITGSVTRAGVENNIDVALRYLDSWLSGNGAAAIHNLMEDAATAEIARAQLWQWIKFSAPLEETDGAVMTRYLYEKLKEEAMFKLESTDNHVKEAGLILDDLVLSETFADFLTTKAYDYLPD